MTAAFALPDAAFEEVAGELPHDGGDLVMFDSALPGTDSLGEPVARITLLAGCYAIRLCVEWHGIVVGSDGEPHGTLLQALRLEQQ